MTASIHDRAVQVMEAAGVRPFQDLPFEWRVSADVRERLIDAIPNWPTGPDRYTWDSEERLFGYVLTADAALPPNAMLLEEWQ